MFARRIALLVAICLTVLAGVGSGPALASATLQVDPSDGSCGTAGHPYCTIQAAVTAASSGDTIEVAAGTYGTSGNTTIALNKANLTLKGAQAGVDARTRGPNGIGGSETVMPATNGPYVFSLQASGLTIDGFDFPDMGPRGFDATTNVDNLTVKNNIFKSTHGTTVGGNIQLGGGAHADHFTFEKNWVQNGGTSPDGDNMLYLGHTMDAGTIKDNYFNGHAFMFGPFTGTASSNPTGWTIQGNEFDGTVSATDYSAFGINANLGDATISDNYVHKMEVGLGQISLVGGSITGNRLEDNSYAAFQLWGGEFSTAVSTNDTIANNTITYNGVACTSLADASHGIRLRPGATPPGGIDPSTIHVHQNSFVNLGVGACGQAYPIRENGTNGDDGAASPTPADAGGNWWGSNVPATVAGMMQPSMHFDFTPLLDSGTDTAPGTIGFQPDLSSVTVHTLGDQAGATGRIQEGVNLVSGSTVNVAAGSYTGDVTIGKSLTLNGAQHGVAFAGRTFGSATESKVTGTITIQAANVTVDGFSVTDSASETSAIGVLVKTAGDSALIKNNIFSGIVATTAGSNTQAAGQAVYLENGPDLVQVLNNKITNVQGYGSTKGVFIGDSSASGRSDIVTIQGNAISNVTSSNKGAYGVLLNNHIGASNLTITQNTFDTLTGTLGWVHAVGIEADAPGLSVTKNTFSSLSAGTADRIAVWFESEDVSYGDAVVNRNSLDVGGSTYGIAVDPSLSGGTVDGTCNWWGSSTGPAGVGSGSGSPVTAMANFTPWLTTSDLNGACAGYPTIGNTTVGGLTHTLGGNYMEVSGPFTLGSSRSLVMLTGRLAGGGSPTNMRAVVYMDNGSGRPGAFAAVSQQVTIGAGQAAGWVDFPVSGSPLLPAGQYWLGYWSSNTSAIGYYQTVPNGGRYTPATYSSGSNPLANFGTGTGDSISYSIYASLGAVLNPPVNSGLPLISGTAVVGGSLSTTTGTWSDSPTFTYQWRQCDSAGDNCSNISGANANSYSPVSGDLGHKLRAVVTATNGDGSTPATSAPSAVIQPAGGAIFGNFVVGGSTHVLGGSYLEASGPFTLGSPSGVSKLTGYLAGGGSATNIRAVIYADNGSGRPGAFVAVTMPRTIGAGQAANWVDFSFASAPTLPAGQYWLGYWSSNTNAIGYYQTVANGGRYAAAAYSASNDPPANFGGTGDSISYSIYATLGTPPCPTPAAGAVTFESPFTVGSINGQQGWTKTGSYDVAVASVAGFPNAADFCFGSQALRASNAVTSGSFADQTFASPVASAAGESTGNNHFDASFKIGSTKSIQEPGLFLSISPSDGSDGRMSYVGFDDQADGIHVIFYDVPNATTPGPCAPAGCAVFRAVDVATIDRTHAHSIKFSIDFVPGSGNDVVKLYVDGDLKITGTSWENYFRFDPEQAGGGNVVPTTSTLIFRAGGANDLGSIGDGYLFDEVAMASSNVAATTTLGNTSVGGSTHTLGGNYLEVSGPFTLADSRPVVKLTGYLTGGGSPTKMRAVIYADSGGQPGALVLVSDEVTIAAGQPGAPVDFAVSGSPTLSPGQYWLGYWSSNTSAIGAYQTVVNGGRYQAATYSSINPPPASFGAGVGDSISYSLYVTLGTAVSPPVNTTPPSVTGTAVEGGSLNTTDGSWTGNTLPFTYQWQRCDSSGANCTNISGATANSYTPTGADVGYKIRAVVTGHNADGGTPAASNLTAAVVTPAGNTFGNVAIGSSTHPIGGGYLEVSDAVTLGTPSTLIKLTGYLAGGATTTKMRAVIYADSGAAAGCGDRGVQRGDDRSRTAGGLGRLRCAGLAVDRRRSVLARLLVVDDERGRLLPGRRERGPVQGGCVQLHQRPAGQLRRRHQRLDPLHALRDRKLTKSSRASLGLRAPQAEGGPNGHRQALELAQQQKTPPNARGSACWARQTGSTARVCERRSSCSSSITAPLNQRMNTGGSVTKRNLGAPRSPDRSCRRARWGRSRQRAARLRSASEARPRRSARVGR